MDGTHARSLDESSSLHARHPAPSHSLLPQSPPPPSQEMHIPFTAVHDSYWCHAANVPVRV